MTKAETKKAAAVTTKADSKKAGVSKAPGKTEAKKAEAKKPEAEKAETKKPETKYTQTKQETKQETNAAAAVEPAPQKPAGGNWKDLLKAALEKKKPPEGFPQQKLVAPKDSTKRPKT